MGTAKKALYLPHTNENYQKRLPLEGEYFSNFLLKSCVVSLKWHEICLLLIKFAQQVAP